MIVDNELPVVTLTVEYAYTFPLEGPYTEFDLPAGLLSDLGDWQGFFDLHFNPHGGWDSDQARVSWAEQADDLAFRLRRALWEKARVEVDLWPLDEQRSDSSSQESRPQEN